MYANNTDTPAAVQLFRPPPLQTQTSDLRSAFPNPRSLRAHREVGEVRQHPLDVPHQPRHPSLQQLPARQPQPLVEHALVHGGQGADLVFVRERVGGELALYAVVVGAVGGAEAGVVALSGVGGAVKRGVCQGWLRGC